MRVLLVSVGVAGDLLPFVAVGKALRARGHDVTVLGNAYFRDVVTREGLAFSAVCSVEEHLQRAHQRSGWNRRRALTEGGQNLLKDMPNVFEAIASHYVPGETLVAAAGMMFGARIAQEKFGLPLATVHLSPICFRSTHDPLQWPSWTPLSARRAAFWLINRVIDRSFGAEINAFRARLGLAPAARILSEWWNSPQLVLGLFPDWLSAPQPDWPANTVLTGFPLYDTLRSFTAQRELNQFLAAGEPPLVFSHSSAVLDAQQFFTTSIAVARTLGCRAVLLTPHTEQVPQPLPEGVRLFPFVPHSVLLPRAAAVVHHGGIGTAFQALAAGIPQLIVPIFLDQPDNGHRLTRLGVARTIRPSAYRAREVTRKLDYLLTAGEVRERCRTFAVRCRIGDPAENVCAALERLFAASRPAPAGARQRREEAPVV
jgi:rhamnosyltransferase subunit B